MMNAASTELLSVRTRRKIVPNKEAENNTPDLSVLAGLERQAYWVAMRVTKSSALAEESVQDAYVSLLSRLARYRDEDHMRKSFLIAVRRQALTMIRGEKRRLRRESACAETTPLLAATPEETIKADEVARAAQMAMDNLPLEEREAVSLCIEQGFSREAAAEILSISKQTVIHRVNRGLEKLRKILAQQGYSVATPMAVGAALSSLPLPAVPAGLTAALQNLAANPALAAAKAARLSAKVLSGASTKSATAFGWMLVSLTLLAALAGGVWWWGASLPSGGVETKTGKNQTVAPVEKNEDVYHCWTFENGPPEGFQTILGKWDWRNNPETKEGEMTNFGPLQAAVAPPVKMPNQPFEVKITVGGYCAADVEYLKKSGSSYGIVCDAYWASPEGKIPCIAWGRWHTRPIGQSYVVRAVFTGNYAIQYIDGEVYKLMEYERPYPDEKFFIFLKNCTINKIEVRTLRTEELTEELREPLKNIERFKLNPWSREP
jgi:RNA polymerase sigma-70 factor (ECF subfamily)